MKKGKQPASVAHRAVREKQALEMRALRDHLLSRLAEAIVETRKIEGKMPLHRFGIFLKAVTHEGKSVGDFADDIGISRAAATRNVQKLSRSPLGLLTVTGHSQDRRRKVVTLAPHGHWMARHIGLALHSPIAPTAERVPSARVRTSRRGR